MNSVFHDLYDHYHQDLFKFLIYLTRDRDLAEDLVQEVYVRVLKSYDRFKGNSSEKTWLFSIAKNVAVDHFRKQKTLKRRILERFEHTSEDILDPSKLPEEIILQSEEIRRVFACLSLCTLDQQMVIITRYIQEFSIEETAHILGWTKSKVKTTQHRALNVLREKLKNDETKEALFYEGNK
ncbi:RNA polymerase sigma factor SigX [Bacillus coahuilensis p1.1.43]|uniref:RNA polymerase sigma factor n=1 Tax=Bacillus coahuilensis p1.1.43 TaxID=1150625 RepID=A0A147K7U3_9BACI|nr:RNA polymerase sigma factor SigX [Bacillus coahuilensis]KUP06241.1 RNA polymerase sigma factor SigX [Bacillus coahuilensis p1.1.43]